MSFVENGGDYAIAMVDNLLDILTKGEHAKTKALLEQVRKGFTTNITVFHIIKLKGYCFPDCYMYAIILK